MDRVCSRCKEIKDENKFYNSKSSPSGKRYQCKACDHMYRDKTKRRDNARYRTRHPERDMYHRCQQRARKKGIEFTLTEADIVIPDICPVLGIPLVKGIGQPHMASPSMDRIDNSKGYTKDNTEVISMRANLLKADATIDEIERILAYMKSGI